MSDDWTGAPFPAFELEDLEGRPWSEHQLRGCRAVVFCFASW